MTENRVEVLCPGMIRRDGPYILEARSSVTLIVHGDRKALVDTSGQQNRELILGALRDRGISPDDIEAVVMTHLHHDHDSNLDLFPNATRYAHVQEGPGGAFHEVDEDFELWEGVRVIHTPGHTRGSMSVLVKADKVYGLVGDAIPTEDNVRKWVPPGVHYDREAALKSMERLVRSADVIVPGHGPSFRTEEYRRMMKDEHA